ncbi:MAG: hypothetical protein ACREFQ_10275 [Stellaceae bacterium]
MTAAGFPVSPETLATKATRGGGPPFQRFGRVPLYRWVDCLDWAQSRLSRVVTSTAELDAARHRNRTRAVGNGCPKLDGQDNPSYPYSGAAQTTDGPSDENSTGDRLA